VPHETLKDAATLTLWFSDLRKNGKGEEINTLRKFVKKAKGQKPGGSRSPGQIHLDGITRRKLERLKGSPS